MFSSLATFLFGAQATSESTNSEANPVPANLNDSGNDQAAGDVIEVTSSTPSVAGNNRGTVRAHGKRGGAKNRRGRQRQQQQLQQQQQQGGQRKQPPTITKLLTPNGECIIDEEIDEDEWFIVEKEDEEEDSLPRSDSEEELSVGELQPKAGSTAGGAGAGAASPAAASRRRQHINSHSLYSGPRPQQQRNYLQRSRAARTLSISTLSPPRSVPAACDAGNDSAVSQSLYAPPTVSPAVSPCSSESSSSSKGHGAGVLMEESWYVTPPPCFTSIGPINMEASPFENLLIEHPSMSVYHSIRSSQAGAESFVNLDLGAAELPQPAESQPEPEPAQAAAVQQQRSQSARYDRHAAVELKQQTLARHSQKSNNKKQRQQLCRSAINRANKVRESQAKGHRPRRSDMQHCKLVSGANNNRKCC